ncbi:Ubiquitin-like protein 4A-B, partial [Nibea albiflora]
SLQVTEDEKVSTVKELVSERLNIPANQQRLLYKGKALAGIKIQLYWINTKACKDYERSLRQLSLDDIERLAGRLLHPDGEGMDTSYMD